MSFIILCAIVSFIVQLVILFHPQSSCCKLRYISLLLLEFLPLSGALYYVIRQPYVPYLGWKFDAAMCLWIACAVLIGYILAWVVYAVKKRE